jgi:hypothetical protein
MTRSRLKLIALCALALLALGAFTGCGKSSNKPGETVGEGLSTPLGGLRYTVFITRQLNLRNEEDSGYLPGYKEAAPGHGLYGVFLQACNKGDNPAPTSADFYIQDAQGNKYSPITLGPKYPFRFHMGRSVPPKNCEPVIGSLAQQGPTSGALLLFNLPLASTENRPLELHIVGPFDSKTGKNEQASVILDI